MSARFIFKSFALFLVSLEIIYLIINIEYMIYSATGNVLCLVYNFLIANELK